MSEFQTYAGFCVECRGLMTAIVNNPARKKEVAKHVAEAIRYGERVELMETEAVRRAKWGHTDECSKKPKPKRAPKQEQLAL